jgi:hypothetical protein
MAACRSSFENTRKMSLIPFSTKIHHGLIWLGVHGKLVKYIVHLSKRKNRKNKIYIFTQAAQTTIDEFLVSRNFRG